MFLQKKTTQKNPVVYNHHISVIKVRGLGVCPELNLFFKYAYSPSEMQCRFVLQKNLASANKLLASVQLLKKHKLLKLKTKIKCIVL